MRQKFLIIGVVALSLPLGAVPFVADHLVARSVHKLESDQQAMRTLLPPFVADLKVIAEHPPFASWTRAENAENFLRAQISWEGTGEQAIESPSHRALRQLFAKYPRGLTDEYQLSQVGADPLLNEVDTTWLSGLHRFDHWLLASHPSHLEIINRARHLGALGRIRAYAELPMPNFLELRQFAFVHVLKSHRAGKTLEAAKDFRQAAHLAHTTGSLVGEMIAVAMLQTEHRLARFTQTNRWKVIPERRIEAYKRVSWGWAGWLRTSFTEPFPRDLEPFLKPELGICGGVSESVGGLTAFRDHLEPRWPLERDFHEPLDRLASLQKRTQELCGLENLHVFTSRTPASGRVFSREDYRETNGFNPAGVPYLRRVFALSLLTFAKPNFMRFYTSPTN